MKQMDKKALIEQLSQTEHALPGEDLFLVHTAMWFIVVSLTYLSN